MQIWTSCQRIPSSTGSSKNVFQAHHHLLTQTADDRFMAVEAVNVDTNKVDPADAAAFRVLQRQSARHAQSTPAMGAQGSAVDALC